MKTLTIQIPDNLNFENEDLLMLFATMLYEKERISLGQAAEVAGLSKRTFTELMGRHGVSVFNNPVSDLSDDVANA